MTDSIGIARVTETLIRMGKVSNAVSPLIHHMYSRFASHGVNHNRGSLFSLPYKVCPLSLLWCCAVNFASFGIA